MSLGVSQGVLIGSLANRVVSDGIDVFPNLGYKKDTFLQPSLVSFTPRGPDGPLPVDSVGRSTMVRMHGVYSYEAWVIKLS